MLLKHPMPITIISQRYLYASLFINKMTYRIAIPEEYKAIALLHARNWQTHYRGILTDDYLNHHIVEDFLKKWEKRLYQPKPSQHIIVAESEG